MDAMARRTNLPVADGEVVWDTQRKIPFVHKHSRVSSNALAHRRPVLNPTSFAAASHANLSV
jgi:hypothetical protein